jgi:hypothetical protein
VSAIVGTDIAIEKLVAPGVSLLYHRIGGIRTQRRRE